MLHRLQVGASLAGVPYTVGATVASAGGKGVEEALDEDAEFNQAFGYGLINAGIEGLIEYATAGMGKGITSIGKSIGKGTAKSAAKSLGKVVLEEAASEAIEEGLTELLNPLAKGVTYKDFGEEMKRYGDAQLYKDTGYAALTGGTVGGITAVSVGIIFITCAAIPFLTKSFEFANPTWQAFITELSCVFNSSYSF